MLHALSLGADWVWLADDDGRPQDTEVLATLLASAERHGLAEVSPMICDLDRPELLAFPLRRGVVWRRSVSELRAEAPNEDLLPGIAHLFNGALFRAETLEATGVPDLRMFIRGDETEIRIRAVNTGARVLARVRVRAVAALRSTPAAWCRDVSKGFDGDEFYDFVRLDDALGVGTSLAQQGFLSRDGLHLLLRLLPPLLFLAYQSPMLCFQHAQLPLEPA